MTMGNMLLEKQDEKLVQEKEQQIKTLMRLQEAISLEKERSAKMEMLHPSELEHAKSICDNLKQQAINVENKKKEMMSALKHENSFRSGNKK